MSGLFGNKSESTNKVPKYIENASKDVIKKARDLYDSKNPGVYSGPLVAGKNSYYDSAGKYVRDQRSLAGKNFAQADRVLDSMDRGGKAYSAVDSIYNKGSRDFTNSMNRSNAQLADLSKLGGDTRGAMAGYSSLPGIVSDSQGRAEGVQLGVGGDMRDILGGALAGADRGYGSADMMTRRAAGMDGTNTGAIADRMNPYSDLVLDKNLRDFVKQRSIGGNSLNDAARAAGSFGGSRHGVAQGMFDAETSKGIGDLITTGNESAYNSALNQLNADRANLLSSGAQISGIQGARDSSTLGYTGAIGDSAARDAALIRQGGLDLAGATKDSAAGRMAGERQLYDFGSGLADRYADQAGRYSNQSLALGNAKLASQAQRFGQDLSYADAQSRLGQADQASRQAMAADLLGYGRELRDITQKGYDSKKSIFDEKRALPYEDLNWLSSIIQGQPYTRSTSSTSSQGIGNPLIGGISTILGGILSDEDKKKNRNPADLEGILASISDMPVDNYDYKDEVVANGEAPDGRRVGPMAQDFAENFGGDGKTIDIAQMLGVLTAAIKGLEERTRDSGANYAANDYGGGIPRHKKRAA